MDNLDENFSGSDTTNPVENKDHVDVYRDPLTFDLDDKTFLEYAKALKKQADDFWGSKGKNDLTIDQRRLQNKQYLFGRQKVGYNWKKYNSKAQDNILWESEAYLRAMAVSKLPDITVLPGGDSEDSKKMANDISKIVTSDIQSRERKRALGLAFKHLPVYFTGVIKAYWNPQKGKYGDYDFKAVLPSLLTLDYRASGNDVRNMDFIFETCEYTVKELVMMFPNKEKELYDELRAQGKFGQVGESGLNEGNEKGMNSKVKIEEVWFKWYDQPKGEKEKDKWEEIIGVGWYYGDLLLNKLRHPYWDWSGTPQTFTYKMVEIDGKSNMYQQEKQPVDEQQILGSMMDNTPIDGAQTETVFHNHLDYPEFPYILLGMDQWGETPLDETSRIEQAIPIQEEYDKRNRQLTEIIDRSRGKHVFSSSQGLTKDDIQTNDMSDPEQDIIIKGDVAKMHAFIPGEQPSPALIGEITSDRERIFDKMGVHQASRGQIDSDTAATNNQIAREGDFTRMDDLVDDTINYAAEKMANWEMQFIKLFYTDFHIRRILGPDGQWMALKLHRDLLDDGMQIVISASGADKLKAEQRAMDMAKLKMIDPFRFYQDVGASDPKGRTIDLMTFLMHPDVYLQGIISGNNTQGIKDAAIITANAQVQNGQTADQNAQLGAGGQAQPPQPGQPDQGQQPDGGAPQQGDPQALQDIMQITQGQIPPIPQQISQGYAETFNAFMQSQQVEQLIQQYGPQFKQALIQFAQAIAQMSQGQGQQTVGPQPQTPKNEHQQFGGNTPEAVGPTANGVTPTNTRKVNATGQL